MNRATLARYCRQYPSLCTNGIPNSMISSSPGSTPADPIPAGISKLEMDRVSQIKATNPPVTDFGGVASVTAALGLKVNVSPPRGVPPIVGEIGEPMVVGVVKLGRTFIGVAHPSGFYLADRNNQLADTTVSLSNGTPGSYNYYAPGQQVTLPRSIFLYAAVFGWF